MPKRTFVEIPEEEQAQMLAALRRARYGSLLALHNLGGKDDAPSRIERLARLWVTFEQLKCPEAMVLADELDIHLLPKVGYAWMPKGTQMTGMTPGTHEKHCLAGALGLATGALLYGVAVRKTNALFRELFTRLDGCYPAERYTRL
jgi:hypothetical protein